MGNSWRRMHCQHQTPCQESCLCRAKVPKSPFSFPRGRPAKTEDLFSLLSAGRVRFVTYARQNQSVQLLQRAAEEGSRLSLSPARTDLDRNIWGSVRITTSRNAPDFFSYRSFLTNSLKRSSVKKRCSPRNEYSLLWGRRQQIWTNF